MTDQRHAFEQLASANYETIKDDVLATLRGQLAADNMHVDPLDLEAAYNLAWHALSVQMEQDSERINNLGGWLAMVAYRRAIDELRRSRGRLQAGHLAVVEHKDATDGGYELDVDADLDDRDAYHQWRISVRLRLNAREQQAVRLCVQHSHKEASARMGISPNRLHKLMTSANKKLDGLVEVINRGQWCQEQRSLITAFAFCLHEPDGERHQLAAAHVAVCPGCAAYVRALRGIAVVVPPMGGVEGLTAGSGGLLAGLTAALKGAGGGTAAGGGVLATVGGKTAVICATAACAVGGAVVVIEQPADQDRTPKRTIAKQPAKRVTATPPVVSEPVRAARRASSKPASRRTSVPNPNSQTAQQLSEFGPETSANSTASTPPARPTQPVQTGGVSEFGPE